MASAALPPPAGTSDALDMVLTGLRYLNAADPTAMLTAEQARILRTLEQFHAMSTAAHAAVLGAFTAAQGYCEDGEYSPRSWLIHQGDITRATAFAHTAWSRRAEEHPKIAPGHGDGGILSESWARALCEITGKLPPDKVDEADALLVWTKLHGATLADLGGLATEMYLRSLPDGPPDPEPADRSAAAGHHPGRRRGPARRPGRRLRGDGRRGPGRAGQAGRRGGYPQQARAIP